MDDMSYSAYLTKIITERIEELSKTILSEDTKLELTILQEQLKSIPK